MNLNLQSCSESILRAFCTHLNVILGTALLNPQGHEELRIAAHLMILLWLLYLVNAGEFPSNHSEHDHQVDNRHLLELCGFE
jgi:hypothetical protein